MAVLAAGWTPAAAQSIVGDASSTTSDFENGRTLFHRSCAQCHGRNMVNSGNTVYDLRKFPLEQPDRFFTSVRAGKGDMPAYRDALTVAQVSWLWAYVSSRGNPAP